MDSCEIMKENKKFIVRLLLIPIFVGAVFAARFFGYYEPQSTEKRIYENYSFELASIEPIAENIDKINLNTATSDELCVLYGIGEKTASAIIDYREQNGDFQKPSELRAVKGIGDKKYIKIADNICVNK